MRYFLQRSSWQIPLPLLFLTVLLGACNDAPGPIGSDYLPLNVEFKSYTLRSDEFEALSGVSVASNSSGEGGSGILVGNAEDGSVAHGLFAITNEAELLASGLRPVTDVKLRLRGYGYAYGDTATPRATFDVVVLDEVFASNVKWDESLATRIENGTVLGSVDTPFNDSGFVEVALNTEAATKFLREYYRWDTTSRSADGVERSFRTLKSIALRAKVGSKTIVSFIGSQATPDSLRPSLIVTLGDVKTTLNAGVAAWIAKNDIPTGPGLINLGAGTAVRSLIKFKLDSIPTTAVIHQAELRLHVKPDGTRHGTLGPTTYLAAYAAADTSLNPNSYLITSISGFLSANRLARDEKNFTDTFRINTLAPIIGNWLRFARGQGGVANRGLILAFNRATGRPNLETTTIDRISFHGPDAADSSLRPSLTIIYSIQADATK